MENFKSFGRKITVPFLQGFTAITGPNGSGKSNIADAILFVLGPKSSKAIRAGKLTDLIWNGGKDKKGADSCQVSLLFDNSDRQIPVEADEVKLTRYVGLSPSVEGGYNSYFYINDRKSSLSEFDSLLAHARISAEGYNLVQQGDIQRIVSMSSVERRRILDNIAGITKFDDDIGQAEGKRKETEDNLERIRIILDESDKQIKQLEADRDRARTYADRNEKRKQLRADAAEANKEKAKVQKETDALARERANVDKRVGELDEQIKGADKDLHEVDELASKSDAKVLNIQKQIIALNNEIEEVEEKLKGLVLEGDRTKEAMARVESEIGLLEESRKQYAVEHDDAEWQLKELKSSTKESGKSLEKLQEDFHGKRTEEGRLAKEQADLQTALLSLTRQYAQLKAEADVAENMKRGYGSAVSAILECRETGSIKGIHGTVAQLAHVDSQYETAIVTAAGARMQAIIVDDDSVAAQCIDYLKKRKVGRATFLPLTKMLVGKPRGKAILVAKECLGFAIDLCHFDEKYRDAFFYVFGDTLVVQTLDEARKWMGGVRLVTTEGELIESAGAMVGGEMEKSTVRLGPSSAGALEKIAEKLREAQAQAENVANRLDEIRKEILALEETIKDTGGRSGAVEVKASTLEAKRKEFAAKLAAADKDLADRKGRFEDARKTATRIEEDLEKFTKAVEALKSKRDERKKAVMEATPQQISSKMKELMSRRATLAEELSGLRSKGEAMATQTAFLEERRGELDARIGTLDDQRKDHEKRIETFQESLGRLETEIRGLEKTEAQLGKKMKDLQDARDAAYKEKTDREADLDKATHKIETKEDFLLKMQTELKVQEEQLAEAERVMTEMAVEVKEGRLPSLEELKSTIGECEAAITALGPINLRALEDYDAQQARAVELKDEFKRLEGQREELIHLVEQLTDRKKEGLAKVFTAISENFKRVYAELSEGGEADLVLEDPEKPFEAGLILKVKPAHKKVLRLEALSGGEKSLASMALIFAIQEYYPSPFYLLDEIDQNLDAVNAEKVARMIRRNSNAAQFVQISLRKVSLKEADHLIGVTMTPESVSEVIMRVNLADIEDEKPEKPSEVLTA